MSSRTTPPEFLNRLVLIVDDDEHTRVLLRDLCESSGFRTSLAEDGEVALQSARQHTPDLVLLDLMMPHRDGFSVLKVLRDEPNTKDLPVIVLTAMGDMDGKIRGMELGADDYVTKPFKLVELQTRITSALTVREYRRRLAAAEEELTHFRALDPVTGAGTYSHLKASLDAELARSRRYGRPAACIMFGFHEYQQLRYQLGRDACDTYLARLVQGFRGALRGADRLFRIDSDEFIALLPETDLVGARKVAERLIATLREQPAETAHGPQPVVMHFGAAVFPGTAVHSSEDLLREANRSFRALQASTVKLLFDA